MLIKLTNGAQVNTVELANQLNELADWLREHSETVYACDCEDDGYYERDTGAYIHHRDCPTWLEHHNDILLRSVVAYFREQI